MLPGIKISFTNGVLGAIQDSPDGVVGLVMHGKGVAPVGVNYTVTSPDDARTQMNFLPQDEAYLDEVLEKFYELTGKGAELWVRLVPLATSYEDMISEDAKSLCISSNGRIRAVMALMTLSGAYTPTIVDGLDNQVWAALNAAKTLRTQMTEENYAPVAVLLNGYGFDSTSHTAVPDLHTYDKSGVGIVIGDGNLFCAAIAGRIASTPVQRKASRVKDGSIMPQVRIDGVAAIDYPHTTLLNDLGYIVPRTFVGRAGVYVADDHTATALTDDYESLTACRTIDKAYRIAYQTMLNELNDEVPINANGTIQAQLIKSWQGKVNNAIYLGMTANGELSADPADANDKGVVVFIDPNQNVVQTGEIAVSIAVRPFGYAKYINISLGFTVTTN